MGLRLIGAIFVFSLLAIGLYRLIERLWPTGPDESTKREEDR